MSRGRDNAPRLRYIYHDEPIRCFDSKDEAERYARIHLSSPSNPDFRWFRHAISILVTWEQVKLYLVNYRFDRRTLPRALVPEVPRGSIKDNPFFIHREKRNPSDERDRIYGAIAEQIIQRLELPFYRELSENSITNMLQYLFYHMRCGIFVSIKNNRLHMFVPFANNNYKNNWKGKGRFDEWSQGMDLKRYYEEKEEIFRRENVLPIEQWWANGNIICNEKPKKVWGDHLLVPLRDMLIATCKSREVPDVDFFINKRDFPHLKSNLTEPYDFIFDQKDLPLSDFRFETYAPIVSFFCSPEFADLPFPSADDWEIVTGKVFPPKGGENYSISKMTLYQVDWNKKIPTAFWRGSATGGGITPETNQRLKVSELSSSWNDDEQYNDKNSIDGFHFLDAGVTTWNIRDKKLFSEPMTYLNPERLSFSSAPFVPMYEQAKYKYIVYVEGHCAAARYLFLMSLGCVILRVKSTCVASELWFFPILSAWDDHVPVDSDLSNLAECIAWCKTHDEECRKIAERSRFLFTQYFSRSNVLDYLQFIMFEISARFNAKNSSNGVKRASEMDSVESSNKRRKVNDEFFGIGSPISLEERKSLKILDHASNYLVKQLTTSNIGDVSLQFFLAHAPDDTLKMLIVADDLVACEDMVTQNIVKLEGLWWEHSIKSSQNLSIGEKGRRKTTQAVALGYLYVDNSTKELKFYAVDLPVLMIDGKNRARDKKTNVRMQWLLNYFKYPCSNGLITPLSVEVAQFRTLRRVESLLSDSKSLTFNSKGLCFIRDSLLYPVKGKFAIDVVYEWTGSYIDADSHEDSDLFNERTNREYFVCTAKSRILPPQGIGSTRDLLERIQEARLRRNSSPGEIPTPLLIQTLLNAR